MNDHHIRQSESRVLPAEQLDRLVDLPIAVLQVDQPPLVLRPGEAVLALGPGIARRLGVLPPFQLLVLFIQLRQELSALVGYPVWLLLGLLLGGHCLLDDDLGLHAHLDVLVLHHGVLAHGR